MTMDKLFNPSLYFNVIIKDDEYRPNITVKGGPHFLIRLDAALREHFDADVDSIHIDDEYDFEMWEGRCDIKTDYDNQSHFEFEIYRTFIY